MGIVSSQQTGIPSRVLGIDASTHTLAFCYMEDGRPVSWGELKYRDSDNLFERLGSIEQRTKIIVDKFPDVEFVMIEAPVKIRNVRVAISLAYSYGIVAAKFASHGIRVTDVPPVTWQRHIGNVPFSMIEKKNLREDFPKRSKSWYSNEIRKQRKQRTMDWVEKTYGIKARNDNVSDSIAIATFAFDTRWRR